MYNFYPGPSKIYPSIKGFAHQAFESGILEKNHRSHDFMLLLEQSILLLKKHLNIPENYQVFFTSSATECWEICAQSFLNITPVDFIYNGAFGEKWWQYTKKLHPLVKGINYDYAIPIPNLENYKNDICLVLNETSNGTKIDESLLPTPIEDRLIILDVVSSLAGISYTIEKGDIWLSSVQKCFGLPSGMGIMIVSPKAMERAEKVNDRKFYNSALFVNENFQKFQTPYTPNILGIYMLKRLMEQLPNIKEVSLKTEARASRIYSFLNEIDGFNLLVKSDAIRSSTVIAVECNNLQEWFHYLSKVGVIMGKGYGKWSTSTFRIANFPAIADSEFDFLFHLLTTFAEKNK